MDQKAPRSTDGPVRKQPATKNGWDLQERRRFPRTSLALPAQLKPVSTARATVDATIQGVTRDVSRAGCSFITNVMVAEGTRCTAHFPEAFGRLEPDTVLVEVIRTSKEPGGVLLGLEFQPALDVIRITPTTGKAIESPANGPHRVLVVDDREGFRGLLARFLAKRGLDVETARDGEEAFRALVDDPPDVMLLDLYLPRLNGVDLLRRMKDLDISVDVIFTMSGQAVASDAQECLRLGAVDHLLKPIDPEHLHRCILLRLGAVRV